MVLAYVKSDNESPSLFQRPVHKRQTLCQLCGSACRMMARDVPADGESTTGWCTKLDCHTCRNQARVYGSPMFDVALARHNLQAPWLKNADSEVGWTLSFVALWARCHVSKLMSMWKRERTMQRNCN